jgi:hypothetical protein
MSDFIKTGVIKTCRRCGRKGTLLAAMRTVATGVNCYTLLVWDRTETRDIDLDTGISFDRLIDPDYGDGYCK